MQAHEVKLVVPEEFIKKYHGNIRMAIMTLESFLGEVKSIGCQWNTG